ncbi:MAG TPA: biotin carboxylase N-terminal domain-containing protein [Gammaproteobacteria bacterium]|nr:biotin carboxylase N-terminal domain-containing protein [Gammaproteobacteria bacterium]
MFSKLLIANRGEIACRVIRTCRRLGIQTVAVYSDADLDARHVREADERVRIGPAPARDSYLDVRAIVRAARQTGAEAIHPGYGFLSEKLELIDACALAGIVFVGPQRDALARMGSKIESKRLAREVGVACIPGYDGDDQSVERLDEEALAIGFPLLIKASAGGGGKGMKRVDDRARLRERLREARAEALAAFGDDRVLLERCILRPRHVEVQLLGDKHGNLVHLYERECSIQRNYQKLIEEAPAAHLVDAVRARLFEAAVALGRRIAYDSAGTVEFVLDAERGDEPYFLEMNTRLQVEHPVSELTTGIDLVEQQIRVACGEKLAFTQADLQRAGWAIEARVNAEVPEEGYRASCGRVRNYEEPRLAGVRVDGGIDARSEITPHYDSMVAKVIGFGSTRDAALQRLVGGLRRLRIEGIRTNQTMLVDLLEHPAFREALSTGFLSEIFPDGYAAPAALGASLSAAAAAAWAAVTQRRRANDTPLSDLIGFRLSAPAGLVASTSVHLIASEADAALARVEWMPAQELRVTLSGETLSASVTQVDRGAAVIELAQREFHVRVDEDEVAVWSDGAQAAYRVVPDVLHPPPSARAEHGENRLIAELPGLVSQVLVRAGERVSAGEPVLVLEAMKLFHTLVAPFEAIVAAVEVEQGATVDKGAVLLSFEAP